MVNELLLNILKQKVENNEVVVEDIKNAEYKTAIAKWLETENNPS